MPLVPQKIPEAKFEQFCVALMEIVDPRGEHDYLYPQQAFETAAEMWIKAESGNVEAKPLQLLMADEYESQAFELLKSC